MEHRPKGKSETLHWGVFIHNHDLFGHLMLKDAGYL